MLRLFSLVNKSEVLILDEALSETDEKRESAILQEIKKYFDRSKILFVTQAKNFPIRFVPANTVSSLHSDIC